MRVLTLETIPSVGVWTKRLMCLYMFLCKASLYAAYIYILLNAQLYLTIIV